MGITYEDSGVSIDVADRTIEELQARVRGTQGPEVLSGIGGFSGLFHLLGFKDPVLVSGTDGVGTKLKIAFTMDRHDTVGIDLVGMCVNDVIVNGAKPLFFLDYIATGRLEADVFRALLDGILKGCEQGGMALLGGETAEMPGMYPANEYDLAGFAVGCVEREAILDGSLVRAGDQVIGLPSSGLHSNGFSLVRRVLFKHRGLDLHAHVPELGTVLGHELLTPTRIYVPQVRFLLQHARVLAMAHVTGAGIEGNLPRVLPPGLGARIHRGTWPEPPIFRFVQGRDVEDAEMFRTFNMGLGFLVVVPHGSAEAAVQALAGIGEQAYLVGEVVEDERHEVHVA
jgi:phosphoribosylformylglycinamidine cyclo-ligase